MKLKHLFLIWAFTISIPVFSNKNDLNADKTKEKIYWQFIKERLFDGKTRIVSSFQEDVLIVLAGASNQDSIIVNNLLKELNQLLPDRKIGFGKGELSYNSLIEIGFNGAFHIASNKPIHHSRDINGNQIFYDGFKGIYQYDIFTQFINIKFSDTISYPERKRYIDYAILRSLCKIKGDPTEAKTFIDNAIFNGFDYDPSNTVFTDADKFLLKKLYSNDFQYQFKKFMIKSYSWLYYMKFVNKDYMELRGYTFAIICALIIFILSYNYFFRPNYRIKYLGYLIPSLLMAISFALVTTVFNFFYTNNDIIRPILSIIISTSVIAIVISSTLYFLEMFIIKPTMAFSLQLILKVLLLFILFITLAGFLNCLAGTGVQKFLNFCFIGFALATGRGTVLFLKGITESLIREKDVELSKLRELKAQAEIESLHARMNPHFLYNSLNSIAGLAHSNPDKTEKMALSLSDLFRYTINRNSEQMSCVSDEIDMVRAYLEIEQIRFGDRMSFTIEVDNDLESQLIPKFIIQPLVENAIKHGISKIEGKGEISLSIHKSDESIEIEVADNGPAFEDGLVSGYGLQSLHDLLKLSYGDKAEVNWQNEPQKKICVIIKSII